MIGTKTEILTFLEDKDFEKRWEIKEYKQRRSLDSNSYFHLLTDKLRQKLGISMARCKNHLIADYGQIWYMPDGAEMIYKTNAPEDFMLELETLHTKCVKVTEENGKPVFFYRLYRGSHEYNSAEMAALIRGTIDECKEQGIETMTPAELDRLNALWGQKHG